MHMKNLKKAVLPVAGFGTRFLPATKSIPKEMFPIIDKPLIQFAVDEAISAGISEVIFVLSKSKKSIKNYFDHSDELIAELKSKGRQSLIKSIKNIRKRNIKFSFVNQNHALGVGDAILRAEKLIGDTPFAVIFPDDLIKAKTTCLSNMLAKFNNRTDALIAVQRIEREDVEKYGIVNYQKNVRKIYDVESIVEKPKPKTVKSNLAVVGRFILTPKIFKFLRKIKPGHSNELQLTDALDILAKDHVVKAYEFAGKRFDCGSKIGLLKATMSYAKDHPEVRKEFMDIIKNEDI